MRFIITLLAVMATGASAIAQKRVPLLWDLRIGTTYQSKDIKYGYSEEGEKGTILNYMAELGIDIPLGRKLALETGIKWNNMQYEHDYSRNESLSPWDESHYLCDGRANLFDVPLKLGYKFPLGENTNLRLSAGPYVSFNFFNNGNSIYQAGLTSSLTYEYKYVNLGLSYNFSCLDNFYNQWENGVFVTLGVKFKSKAWKYVGATVLTLATVGTAAAYAYSAAKNSSQSNYSSEYGNSDSSYNKKSGSGSSGNKNSLSEQNNYNTDKRTYANYDSQLAAIFAGNRSASAAEIKQIQSKMRDLRLKWVKKGKNFPQSDNETR